jgi:hypothetical protein
VARELKLEVDDKFERVHNFSLFSVKDMAEIHKLVRTYDPPFMGLTDIEDPKTGASTSLPILGIPSFFFLLEE